MRGNINRQRIVAATLFLLCCLALVGWTGYSQQRAKVQWEYQVIFLNEDANITKELNKVGADGWELVEFHMTSNTDLYGLGGKYYFKRQKQ
jgi:hypothetical protein